MKELKLSKCCHSTYHVEPRLGNAEKHKVTTMHHECDKCGNPCDIETFSLVEWFYILTVLYTRKGKGFYKTFSGLTYSPEEATKFDIFHRLHVKTNKLLRQEEPVKVVYYLLEKN